MKQILIILIGFLICTDCKSCECVIEERDISVSKALVYSDIIFCGELIPVDNGDTFIDAYRFKVLELFKGSYTKNIIFGCYSAGCSIIPQDKGLWIVYAKQVNDSTISISKCSPSIPIIQAERLVPSSFSEDYIIRNGATYINKTRILEKRAKGFSILFAELEKLRQYKKAHSIVSKKADFKIILIVGLILMNITLFSIVIINRRK